MSVSVVHVFSALIINDLEMGNVELESILLAMAIGKLCNLNISFFKKSIIQVVLSIK